MKNLVVAGLLTATSVTLSPVAIAQEAVGEPTAVPEITAESLALAEAIVDLAYPLDTRETMFLSVSEQINAQVMQSLSGQISDDGTMEILQDWLKDLAVEQKAILLRHIPDLMAGFARSYAATFTETELSDILSFVSTNTGQTFMLRSAEIIAEENFAAANQAYMDETMALLPARMEDLTGRMTEYKGSQAGSTK